MKKIKKFLNYLLFSGFIFFNKINVFWNITINPNIDKNMTIIAYWPGFQENDIIFMKIINFILSPITLIILFIITIIIFIKWIKKFYYNKKNKK